MEVKCRLNGENIILRGEPTDRLRDVLYHTGCYSVRDSDDAEGFAGSDTIIFNGQLKYSNFILLYQAEGANIKTAESLLEKGVIHSDIPYEVNYCRGGVSCIAALIETEGKTMLVKQGRAKLAVKEDWHADPARMKIEAIANDFYNKCIPQSAPAVLFYDEENCIMVRDAAPASCRMWKEDLLSGIFDFEVAQKTMEALAIVHNKSANSPEAAAAFANQDIFYQLRISPYFEFLAGKHPEYKAEIEAMIPKIRDDRRVIVHSDYSPKNILVNADRSICILDYEIAHYGNPAFDVAFFTNHIVLKSAHMRQYSAAILNMLTCMTDTYFGMIDFTDAKELEAECIPLLGILMLARIDGKSPAEYITCEKTRQLVRDMAGELIRGKLTTYREAAALLYRMELEFDR